jgi:hypothetical protein
MSGASLVVILVVCGGAYLTDTNSQGAGEGYSANFGRGLVVIACLGLVYITGVISSIAGLIRGEKPKVLLFLILIAFLVPYVALFTYNSLHPIGRTH